ncbi:MAG TPA: hypothetical protein DEG63_11060, partial [Flavobacteriaceae bacterium]|nr:hypothetical protein [Flavobacteriaceae bacterium]
NKIIDGYQYTKEWAEFPLAYDLYRLTNKKITLNNTINIQDLDFKQMDYFTISNKKLDDDSTIIFK